MLDTSLRSLIQPVFDRVSALCEKRKIRPIFVTFFAFFTGLAASFVYFCGFPVPAVAVLWFSGFLDALDGTLARRTGQVSALGSFLDVWFDRAVECGIILSLALRHGEALLSLLCASLAIILSMTAFLLTGALVKNEENTRRVKKSFVYQSGLMERTEGFIIFSLMWLFPQKLDILAFICAGTILFTALQRVILTVITLHKREENSV